MDHLNYVYVAAKSVISSLGDNPSKERLRTCMKYKKISGYIIVKGVLRVMLDDRSPEYLERLVDGWHLVVGNNSTLFIDL